MKPIRMVSLASAGFPLVACWAAPPPQAVSCRTFDTSLSIKSAADQAASSFAGGEPIAFHLATTNTAGTPATLIASSPCTAVVFEVFDAAGERLWGSSDDVGCIQMLAPRTYAPQESVDASRTWNATAPDGAALPPGTYTVKANVAQFVGDPAGQLTDCREQLSRSARFTIK